MRTSRAYGFAGFVLRSDKSELHRGEVQVPLGEKPMKLLLALVEKSPEVISKAELCQLLWPNETIDDSTLRFHIAVLRKALGEGDNGERLIANVSGRGYCFVATVQRIDADLASPPTPKFPTRTTKILGREREIGELLEMLIRQRFVTIAGPGGMGKSSLAFELADRLRASFAGGVFFLDVSLIADPLQLPSTIAHQIGVVCSSGEALETVCRWFHDRHALVLLDSCESQIDACASLARTLLERAPSVHLLSTSREALRVKGEWVFQIRPLATPPKPWTSRTHAEVVSYSAVQLLLERARARKAGFCLSELDVPLVCELVARLDGMPLAIELVSARLPDLKLRGVLDELGHSGLLRAGSMGSGIERHRSLSDLLDWTYERLSIEEQTVFKRISVCNGSFSLETAQAVAADASLPVATVVEAVIGLETKSLVFVERHKPQPRFRLLDSTRAYAAFRLGDGEEHRATRIRQYEHLRETMRRAQSDSASGTISEWIEVYGPVNHDMRGSIAWAFGSDGDAERGVRLVAASIGFAHRLALAADYSAHIARALELLPPLDLEPDVEIALLEGQFVMHIVSRGPGDEMWASHDRILELATHMGSNSHRVEAINGRFVQAYFGHGDYPAAASHADEVAALSDSSASPLAMRLQLQALHGLGDHERAQKPLEEMLSNPPPRLPMRPPFPIDMRVMCRMMLVRIYWLQGRADDALALLDELKTLAVSDIRFALANAYAWSICPLHFWCGDLVGARQSIEAMHQSASDLDVPFTVGWACAYALAWERISGESLGLRSAGVSAQEASLKGVVSELLGTFDRRFLTPALIQRRRSGTLGWCAPEITRAEGEHLLHGGGSEEEARGLFLQALSMSRAHGALAWELRAATSLAKLHLRNGRSGHAQSVLEPVLERHVQGHWTSDYRNALVVVGGLMRHQERSEEHAATELPCSPGPGARTQAHTALTERTPP